MHQSDYSACWGVRRVDAGPGDELEADEDNGRSRFTTLTSGHGGHTGLTYALDHRAGGRGGRGGGRGGFGGRDDGPPAEVVGALLSLSRPALSGI